MTVLPPALFGMLKVLPVKLNVTAVPTLTPIVRDCGEVTVANPVGSGAVTELNPAKFIAVIAEPTEAPLCCNSIPEITSVRLAPDPKKDVALTTPTTFNFSVGDVELTPTLRSVSTEKTLGLPNFDNCLARVITQLLSSYLGHKKRPPSLLTGGREVLVVNQKI
tara:strand:- start:153 stop:644 length:492 start_codon:yes stop_codon:yes gene_type:complete